MTEKETQAKLETPEFQSFQTAYCTQFDPHGNHPTNPEKLYEKYFTFIHRAKAYQCSGLVKEYCKVHLGLKSDRKVALKSYNGIIFVYDATETSLLGCCSVGKARSYRPSSAAKEEVISTVGARKGAGTGPKQRRYSQYVVA